MSDRPDKRPTRRLNQAIPEPLHRRLKVYAAANGLRVSEAIERAIAAGLDRLSGAEEGEETPAPREFAVA